MPLPALRTRALVGAALLLTTLSLAPPQRSAAVSCLRGDAARAAVDPQCTALIATPDLPAVSGVAELRAPPTPFGVAVTRDGQPRYRVVATIAGLPPVASLGAYGAYVAWATTLGMDSTVRLGEVTNGRTVLATVELEQFRILVSAERSASVTEREGRLVLRGTSPGVRLLAHRDFVQPSAPGALRHDAEVPATSGHAGHIPAESAATSATNLAPPSWVMPAMPPWMRPMPEMHALTPDVTPYLPGEGIDPWRVAPVRPREVVRLQSGDTLRLEATLVRRTIGGRTIVMYGYNGQHPGPLLQVQQGATILVVFHNAIDQPSAVHWHGVRLENRSDGAVGVTQAAVMPGERYLYRVRFRDAGIYWYHPHVREDVQQDMGLAGNILVAPTARDYWPPAHREEVLLLDDLLLSDSTLVPYGREAPTHALSGRHGTMTLVNAEPRWSLTVQRGEVVRFHLTNAASARFFNLSFGALPLKVVGSDVGRFEREVWAPSAVIAPAERYVVDVRFNDAGTVPLMSRIQALDHMAGWFFPQVDTLGLVRVLDTPAVPDLAEAFARLRTNRDVEAEFAPLRRLAARPATRSLTLDVRVGEVPSTVSAMLWGMPVAVDWNDAMPMVNWAVTSQRATWILRDPSSGRENMDVRWRFARGERVRLQLYNDPLAAHAMAHPIHVHGQRFLVLSRNGEISTNMVWKDTVVVPVGETVELLVEMSNPGRWMIHCHIAEHLGSGMMMVFDVS